MNLFVTGATGFIGSHFIKLALSKGHSVKALRRAGSKTRIPLRQEPTWVEARLGQLDGEVFSQVDTFVHLAAYGVPPNEALDWDKCFQLNVTDSLKSWQRAAEENIKRFVICGSCFEYGASGERYDYIPSEAPLLPTGAYHASKAAATMAACGLAVDKDLKINILRPFHVFGEGEAEYRLWPSLKRAALAGEDFEMTGGEQVRDFIPVEQVAQQILNACERQDLVAGEPLIENVGTGQPRSLREFAEEWWGKWNAKGELKFGAVPYRENEVMRYVPLV